MRKRRNIDKLSTSDSDYSYNSEKRNKRKKYKKKVAKKNKKTKKNKKAQKNKMAVEKNITQHNFIEPTIFSDDNISENEKIIDVLPMTRNSLIKPIDVLHSEESTGKEHFKIKENPESSVFNSSLNNDYYKNDAIIYNNTNNNVLKSLQSTKLENSEFQLNSENLDSFIEEIIEETPSYSCVQLPPMLNYEPKQTILPIDSSIKEESLQTNHQKNNEIGINMFKLFFNNKFSYTLNNMTIVR